METVQGKTKSVTLEQVYVNVLFNILQMLMEIVNQMELVSCKRFGKEQKLEKIQILGAKSQNI